MRYQTVYKFNLKVAGAALFDQLIQHIVYVQEGTFISQIGLKRALQSVEHITPSIDRGLKQNI